MTPVLIKPRPPEGAPKRLMRADHASGWCTLTVQTDEGEQAFLERTVTQCLIRFRHEGWRLAK